MPATSISPWKPASEVLPDNAGDLPEVEYLDTLHYDVLTEMSVDWNQLDEANQLDAETEQFFFLQMNLALYQAARLRSEVADDAWNYHLLMECRRLIERGQALRNGLVLVYQKLAFAIARSYVTPRFTWDDLQSESLATLLYAITKFNPERGFRFSTYATHAIRRRLARWIQQRLRQETSVDFLDQGLPDERRWTLEYQLRVERELKVAESLLLELNPRERYIIRARFGWGREFDPRTLQEIAEEFGVSRERVRQLEARALEKLQCRARKSE